MHSPPEVRGTSAWMSPAREAIDDDAVALGVVAFDHVASAHALGVKSRYAMLGKMRLQCCEVVHFEAKLHRPRWFRCAGFWRCC